MALTDSDLALIGGSDVSALVGLNPYRTPIDVYRRVVEGYRVPDSVPMRRGRMLEKSILDWYAEDTGAELLPGRSLRSEWSRSSLDAEAVRDGVHRVVEAKSCSLQAARRYGDGPGDIPEEHLSQVTWYMGQAGLPLADLAALLAGSELRIYTVQFDREFYELLFEAARRFWTDHVLTKTPPPLDGSPGASEWLAQRYPEHKAPALPATPEAELAARRLKEVREEVEYLEKEEALARQTLMQAMGDAEGMAGDGWRVSWKRSKSSAKTDWQAVAGELGAPDDVVQRHTTIKPGPRIFRPTWSQK